MILALVSINNVVDETIYPHIDKFIENGWDVRILTNNLDFYKHYNVVYYPYKIFSYYYKLLFPLQVMEKEHKDILYIDIKNLHEIDIDFIKNFKGSNHFLYLDHWQKLDSYDEINDRHIFVPWVKICDNELPLIEPLIDYFNLIKFDYSEMITIWERMMYFPYFDNISDIIYEIEKVKPIFEYMSINDDNIYSKRGIGYGEGLALSYIFTIFDIKHMKFKDNNNG